MTIPHESRRRSPLRPIHWTLALAILTVVAGAVALVVSGNSGTSDFGWFAYAPLSDFQYLPPSSGLSSQALLVLIPAVAGIACLTVLAAGTRPNAVRLIAVLIGIADLLLVVAVLLPAGGGWIYNYNVAQADQLESFSILRFSDAAAAIQLVAAALLAAGLLLIQRGNRRSTSVAERPDPEPDPDHRV